MNNIKDTLLRILDDASLVEKVVFSRTADGEVFVKFPAKDEKMEFTALKSDKFHKWLYYNRNASYAATELAKTKTWLSELDAVACYDESVSVISDRISRIGCYGDKIYLNLCNEAHQIVKVDAEGWKIVKEDEIQEPVFFTKSKVMLPIPVPERGGDLSVLRQFINVDNDDFPYVVSWLLVALNPKINNPILWMKAGKGTGKTTATEYLKKLIDPDDSGPIAPFIREDDFYAAVASRYVIGLDNVSKVTGKWSDMFCRASTGSGFVKRKLYKTNEALDIRLSVPMIMNSIGLVPERSDLRDRCFSVTLLPLYGIHANSAKRKTRGELDRDFENERPKILGALLDAVVAALNDNAEVEEPPVRMVDACNFIIKAARNGKLPFTEEEFRKRLEVKPFDRELEDETAARIVLNIFDDVITEAKKNGASGEVLIWNDLTSKLHEKVLNIASREAAGTKREVPQTPTDFGVYLSGVQSDFEARGYVFSRSHSRGGTKLKITFDMEVLKAKTQSFNTESTNTVHRKKRATEELASEAVSEPATDASVA